MSYQEYIEIKEDWSKCEKCALGKERIDRGEEVCMGKGSFPCDLLIVIPFPKYSTVDAPTPYEVGTPELGMLNKILEKVGIDRQKVFITSTVACKPGEGMVHPPLVDACRPRLVELTKMLNPKSVMLLGPEALYAWTGTNVKAKELGVVKEDTERKVFWSFDFANYIAHRESKKEGYEEKANKILEHWKIIAATL